MDATNIDSQVHDLVKNLTTSDADEVVDAVATYFTSDAVLTTPINSVQGADGIRDVINLHNAFAHKCVPGPITWDSNNKTATFSLKGVYSLAHAPWPFSLLRRFEIPVSWTDVKLSLQTDESQAVHSDIPEPAKYRITNVTAEAHPPKNKAIAAAYSVVLYTVRIVAPYLLGSLVVFHKFFVRHPLKHGLIRTGAAGVVEALSWALRRATSKLPLLGSGRTTPPQRIRDPERVAATVNHPPTPPSPGEPLSRVSSKEQSSMDEPVAATLPPVVEQELVAHDQPVATGEAALERDEAETQQQEQAEEVKETAALQSEVEAVQSRAQPKVEQIKAEEEDEHKVKEDAAAASTLEATLAREETAELTEETKEANALEEEVAKIQARGEPVAEPQSVEAEAATESETQTLEDDSKPEETSSTYADVVAEQPPQHTTTESKGDFPALAQTVKDDVDTLEQPALNSTLPSTDAEVTDVAEAPATLAAKLVEPGTPRDATTQHKDAETAKAASFAAIAAKAAEKDSNMEETETGEPKEVDNEVKEAKHEEATPMSFAEVAAHAVEEEKPAVTEPQASKSTEEGTPEKAIPKETSPEALQMERPDSEKSTPEDITLEEPAQLSFAAVAAKAADHEEAQAEEPALIFAPAVSESSPHHDITEAKEDFPALSASDNLPEEGVAAPPAPSAPLAHSEPAPSFADIAAHAASIDNDSVSGSSSLPGTAEGSVAGDKKKATKGKNKKQNKNKNKNKRPPSA
ncbi:hypothetical protein CC85DRAFT_288390 [Cutaneotrichosporon oleaginosum]|uniref:Uncharacterized protein n=1 Tax=Cutaneotrichosporon oleaginosum TaxID=879819 RepID=A0A0J1AWD2_9TREE|nr:uncharacterized protein CC85DRAFT_288390 [Cutaneotrichosporon oleaginosum]KLT39594.1 hypothetical protein CC85DRAFT_288390 [Cutaneotrichosporon oleaginosum]